MKAAAIAHTSRRRYVTLLELLIVIAILALVGGLVSIGINRVLTNQRFRTEVSLIVDQLRLAQDLMLILGTDARVVFTSEQNNKITFGIELETTISPEIEREILRRKGELKTIKGVFFQDAGSKTGKIVVRFQSKGAVMSKGLMRLATTGEDHPPPNTLQTFICLAGYPRHIYSEDMEYEKANADCKADIDSANDPELTQDTMSKISDLFKSEEGKTGEEQKKKKSEEEAASGPKKESASKPSAAAE